MRWGVESSKRIGHALVLVSLRAALLFGLGLGLIGGALLGDGLADHGWKSVLFLVVVLGGLDLGVILKLGLLRLGQTTLRELGWTFEAVPRDVLLGLAGFAASAGVLLSAYVLTGEQTVAEVFQGVAAYTLAQRLIFATIAVCGAALVEESLFRGYLQPALADRFGLGLAIVLQAILFSLMHLNFHPASLVVKFGFGVIFGVLRWLNRSLLAPGIAHGLIWAVFGA